MAERRIREEKIRCDACPVLCYIAEGRSGACDRYANDKGSLVRLDPLTVIETTDPKYTTMIEEIFGPVLTVYPYEARSYEKTLELVDSTSPYALTGAVFAKDRQAVNLAFDKLRHSAGNFYILGPDVLQPLTTESPDAGANHAVRHQATLCPVKDGT